jgi:methyltransferase family protein
MLDRLKKSSRQKLQSAMEEVVASEHARSIERIEVLHAESMARIDALGQRLDAVADGFASVHDRLNELEHRARRDIYYALDLAATADSAAFVREHLANGAVFWHPHDTLRFAVDEVAASGGHGLALEFGVASGTTLEIIAKALSENFRVVGFDTFEGLPEPWRTGYPAGEFKQDEIPDVAGAELVAGLFEDTLPGFLARTDDPVAFVHLDADLYSSTKTILDHVGDRLADRAVLVFDEFFNFHGWQEHEYRAWQEFLATTGRAVDYLAYTGNNEQVVVRLR